jgi:hypothetical protein
MSARDNDESPQFDEQAEALEAELAESAGDDGALIEALALALRPTELSAAVHDEILARVLAEPKALTSPELAALPEPDASPQEQREAVRLREALAGADETHPLVVLAEATRNAARPRSIAAAQSEARLKAALKAPSKVVFLRAVTVVTVLSAAAAAALLYFAKAPVAPPEATFVAPSAAEFLPGMAESRSTAPLFAREDFPREGGQSARIDRIRSAREVDLRQNRFVAWGVP